MKVVHFSTVDTSTRGGGVRATYDIHRALRAAGCNSHLVVGKKVGNDEDVIEVGGKSRWQKAQCRLSMSAGSRLHTWLRNGTDLLGVPVPALLPLVQGADIIHLHWVANFLTSRQIRAMALHTGAPIVWTPMDLAPLTGGCHYAFNCQGYRQHCGRCPQIGSTCAYDVTRLSWERKARNFRGLRFAMAAPTRWVTQRIKESSLFHHVPVAEIALPIDPQVFRPIEGMLAREVLRLPKDKKIIFFGAASLTDPRKGMSYLVEALQRLAVLLDERAPGARSDTVLLMAGRGQLLGGAQLPFPCFELGYLNNDITLALAYQSADMFVCPSVEDAGPLMIPQAMMCGTPVVAFSAGGAPDLVKAMQTGYLAAYKDSEDLARGIVALLVSDRLPIMRITAREVALQRHDPKLLGAAYKHLYNSLMG